MELKDAEGVHSFAGQLEEDQLASWIDRMAERARFIFTTLRGRFPLQELTTDVTARTQADDELNQIFTDAATIKGGLAAAIRARTVLEQKLAECYRLTGADTDGNEDWRLTEHAVEAVRNLRAVADEAEALKAALRALR